MKISNNFIVNHFTLANSTNSWYLEPTNIYNCKSNNSDTLLVTIGDSWTYGADLSQSDSERIDKVFGNQLSNLTKFDWLNLSIPAQCNHWMVTMVREVLVAEHLLDYKKIIFIITLTGVGRWFTGPFDQTFDYIRWFDENIKRSSDFDKLVHMLNDKIIEDTLNITSTNKKVQLKVGTNFVDHIGLERLNKNQLLTMPWYNTLGMSSSTPTYVCTDGADKLLLILDFLNKTKHDIFKQWYPTIIDKALIRQSLLKKDSKVGRTLHPNAEGHAIWANYILNNL